MSPMTVRTLGVVLAEFGEDGAPRQEGLHVLLFESFGDAPPRPFVADVTALDGDMVGLTVDRRRERWPREAFARHMAIAGISGAGGR